MLVFLVSGYGHGFFFNASLIFPPFSSFNIIERRKMEKKLLFLKEKVYICNRICGYQKDISI